MSVHHHKTALDRNSRHFLIKSSDNDKREKQILTGNANAGNNNIDAAIRIIKNSIHSTGRIDSPLLFQISGDGSLYQIIDLKGTWFHRYRRISDRGRRR
jgi:hypothetical protein